jgi:predicted RecA/RadA family phage recombinase
MATNYIQEGDVLDLLAPYDRTSGQGMQVGSIFAVALGTALSGAAIRGATEGVWLLTKVGSQAWAVGDKVYWDNSNKRCTTVSTDGMLIGVATTIAGAGAGVVTGYVRLNGTSPATAEGQQALVAAPNAITAVDLDNEIVGNADAQADIVAAAAGACAGGATPTATQVDTAIATAVAPLQANDATIAVAVDALIVDITALRATVAAMLVDLKAAGIIASA